MEKIKNIVLIIWGVLTALFYVLLQSKNKNIFDIWNRQYPATEWKREHNQCNDGVMV